MTAKQKANQARFKAVVAEAKKLRKKNPSLNQAQAVKQAWAIMYSKKRGGKKVGETHKDTKSHNVNIRVVSGTGIKKGTKREFQIVRQKDKKAITILSVDGKDPFGRPFDRSKKISNYKSLGYEVLDMKGNKINGFKKMGSIPNPVETLNNWIEIKSKTEKSISEMKNKKSNKTLSKETRKQAAFWFSAYNAYLKHVKRQIALVKRHIK